MTKPSLSFVQQGNTVVISPLEEQLHRIGLLSEAEVEEARKGKKGPPAKGAHGAKTVPPSKGKAAPKTVEPEEQEEGEQTESFIEHVMEAILSAGLPDNPYDCITGILEDVTQDDANALQFAKAFAQIAVVSEAGVECLKWISENDEDKDNRTLAKEALEDYNSLLEDAYTMAKGMTAVEEGTVDKEVAVDDVMEELFQECQGLEGLLELLGLVEASDEEDDSEEDDEEDEEDDDDDSEEDDEEDDSEEEEYEESDEEDEDEEGKD